MSDVQLCRYNGMLFKPYPKPGGTIVALAGGEGLEFIEVLKDFGYKAVLISFFYVKRKFDLKSKYIEDLKSLLKYFDYVYMDSGGFTLQQEIRRQKLKISLKDYINIYYDFAKELRDYVTVFGAVDCIGDDYTLYDMYEDIWRAKHEGIHIAPTIFVYSDLQVIKDFSLIGNFDIVALSGAGRHRAAGIKMFYYLKECNVKVHGYAMTSQEHFRIYSFYSVDSITWLSSQRYGQRYDFRGFKLRTYSPAKKEIIQNYLKPQALKYGIDINLLNMDRRYKHPSLKIDKHVNKEVNKLALISWLKLYNLERNNTAKAYWKNFQYTVKDKDFWLEYEKRKLEKKVA